MTLTELDKSLPWIPWREPILIRILGSSEGYACRICIAQSGLSGSDVRLMSSAQVRAHIRLAHEPAADA